MAPMSSIFCLTPERVEFMSSSPASRESGAGARIASINRSDSVKAESTSLGGIPTILRRKLPTELKNRCSAEISSPFGFIVANFFWNSGLLNASDTNSSTSCAPYALSSISFTSLNSLVSCLVTGWLGLASVADTAACVTS